MPSLWFTLEHNLGILHMLCAQENTRAVSGLSFQPEVTVMLNNSSCSGCIKMPDTRENQANSKESKHLYVANHACTAELLM